MAKEGLKTSRVRIAGGVRGSDIVFGGGWVSVGVGNQARMLVKVLRSDSTLPS